MRAAVDLAHRYRAGKGAGDEGFVGAIDIVEREVALEDRNAVVAAQADHVAAGDARNAVTARRRPHFAAPDDEEMRRVAGRDEAMRVEHQPFVGAGIVGLDAGGDAVELRMRVELLVLHVGVAAADIHGDELQAAASFSGFGVLYSGIMTMVAGEIVTRGS